MLRTALLLLSLLGVCTVAADASLPAGWRTASCDLPPTTTVHADLHLHLSRPATALDAACSNDATCDAMGAARRRFEPSAATRQRARAWLDRAGLGRFCTAGWSVVRCDAVPLRTAEAAFNVTYCGYRAVSRSGAVRTNLPVVVRSRTTPQYPTDVFASVVGVQLWARRPPRRHRVRNAVRSGFHPARPETNALVGWPSGSRAAPVLLGATFDASGLGIASVFVALNCANGAPTNATAATACANASDAPVAVTVFRAAAPATTATATTANTSLCGPASDWTFLADVPLADQRMLVCRVPTANLPPADAHWQWLQLNVTATFANGTTTAPVGARSWYNKTFGGIVGRYSASRTVTPQDAATMYHVDLAALQAAQGNVTQGVIEFSDTSDPGDGISLTDLATFLAANRANAGLPVVTRAEIDALVTFVGNASTMDTDETSLDIQWIMALAPGAPTTIWNVENGPGVRYATYAEAFVAWAADVAAGTWTTKAKQPSVWSISYCGPETEFSDTGDATALPTLSRYLAVMASGGITVAAAAGDWGAVWDPAAPEAFALFPASDPSVIAVGGTAPRFNVSARQTTEVVCSAAQGNEITTGGGYSVTFPAPAAQRNAVAAYSAAQRATIADAALTAELYPPNRRAVPDMSVVATSFAVVLNGTTVRLYGTSGSTPIFAAFVTLVNARRRQLGRGALPNFGSFLYEASSRDPRVIAQDVTDGDNCAGEQEGPFVANYPDYGRRCYSAAPGWDAVSGLGTPNVTALLEVAGTWQGSTPAPGPYEQPADKRATTVLAVVVLCLFIAAGLAFAWFITRKRRRSAVDGDGLDSPSHAGRGTALYSGLNE